MGSIEHFAHVDLFVDRTLLNTIIIAVYSLYLSITIFKIKRTRGSKELVSLTLVLCILNNGHG